MSANMIHSDLRAWAIKNRYFEWKKRPGTLESHRLLDGGVLYIPNEKMNEFFEMYEKSLGKKQQMFVTETTTKIFKLFVDLDFCNPKAIPQEKILEYCKFIQGIVGEFLRDIYSVKERVVIISMSPPKIKTKGGADYEANGIHMNWPNINVDIHDALLLRKAVIHALEANYGRRPFYNTWEEVVDESIYIHGGLRMIGSQKAKICPNCRGNTKKKTHCETCSAFGKIVYPHVYEMISVIDGNEQEMMDYRTELQNNPLKMIKDTSIKTPLEELGRQSLINIQNSLPNWFIPKLTKMDVKEITDGQPSKRKRKRVDPPGKEDIEGMKQFSSNRVPIYENDERFQEIKRFINSQLPIAYKDCIVEVSRCAGGSYYVVRTNSRMCMNFKKAPTHQHNNNTIYFYIRKEYCQQRCFCNCDTTEGREFGKCRDFKSSKYPLTKKLKKILFSDADTKESSHGRVPTADSAVVYSIDRENKRYKKTYISLDTPNGSELLRRENRVKAFDDLLESLIEKASGKKEYEKHKFRFKKDK